MLTKLSELQKNVKDSSKKKLILCSAADEHSLEAVMHARKENIIDTVLVGDKTKINSIASKLKLDINGIEILHETDLNSIVKTAVTYISSGNADILMKGSLNTSDILKGVLNKEWGLRSSNPVLSHLAVFETPAYHKLLALTDGAMNIAPTLQEKVGILNNAVNFLNSVGISNPKVAVLGAVEVVNEKMPATIDAALLSLMQRRGQIKNCIIDGPLAFDNAISEESTKQKGIISDVAGDADLLLAPDIEAGNILYKTLGFFLKAKLGAVILGARVPIVLTSRADSENTKHNSILLASAIKK